jgi:protein O-GlcNAc transferase
MALDYPVCIHAKINNRHLPESLRHPMNAKTKPISKSALKALELDEQGKRPEAIKLFLRTLTTTPTDWAALYSLGRIYVKDGKLAEATKLLQRLVRVHPDYSPGFDALGVALEKQGCLDAAIECYQNCLSLDPRSSVCLVRLGALMLNRKQHEDAIGYFTRALEIDPNSEMALSNLGQTLFGLKRFTQAGAIFKRLVALNPNYRFAKGLLTYNMAHQADWAGIELLNADIVQHIRAGVAVCMPLAFMAISPTAQDSLRCAQLFCAHFYPSTSPPNLAQHSSRRVQQRKKASSRLRC